MSRGVNTARSSSESLFYSVTSIAWVKGRAEHEQVAKLTARGRLLRAQFWVPVHIFQTSPGFFRTVGRATIFFVWRDQNRLTFRYLILWHFVTSGGVFSVLKSVEMCDQFLAWRAQCTSPPEFWWTRKRVAVILREHLPDDFLPPPPIQTSLPLSESDQGNLVGNFLS